MNRQMVLQVYALMFSFFTGVTVIVFAFLVVNAEIGSLMIPEMGQTMIKEVILPRALLVTAIFLVPAVVFGLMARKTPEAPATKKSR